MDYVIVILFLILFLTLALVLVFISNKNKIKTTGGVDKNLNQESNQELDEIYQKWKNIKKIEKFIIDLNPKASYESLNILERMLISKLNKDSDASNRMQMELIRKNIASTNNAPGIVKKIDELYSHKDLKDTEKSKLNNISSKFTIESDGTIKYRDYSRKISTDRLKTLRSIKGVKDADIVSAAIRYSNLLPRGQQWHVPSVIYKKLMSVMGITLEGFASPFNFNVPRFCSIMPKEDAVFGSIGSFFDTSLSGEKVIINPPYIENILNLAAKKSLDDLDNPEETLIIFISPEWKDANYHIELSKSPYLVKKITHTSGTYYYENEGARIPAKFNSTWFILSNFDLKIDYLETINKLY